MLSKIIKHENKKKWSKEKTIMFCEQLCKKRIHCQHWFMLLESRGFRKTLSENTYFRVLPNVLAQFLNPPWFLILTL